MSTTILYARVSTAEQTIALQETEARRAGFVPDYVLQDRGVSGVNVKLADRPQGRRLFDMLRHGDVLVVRWVDRLGRNYEDVTNSMREFMRRGVIVRTIINGMEFDGSTTDPMKKAVRDAMIAFMSASAEAQAAATKEAQRAGVAYAQANGSSAGVKAYRGRKPSFTRQHVETVDAMLGTGSSVSAIAEATGLTRQTVYRIRDNRADAEAALVAWAA